MQLFIGTFLKESTGQYWRVSNIWASNHYH